MGQACAKALRYSWTYRGLMLRVVSVDHLTESNFILQAIGSPEKFSDRGVMRSDGQFPYGD